MPDGVSIVAGSWRRALRELGWNTVTIAGEGPVDRVLPWLAIGSSLEPDAEALERALDDVDVVIVENLLTIPMHLAASRVVADVLRGRPSVLHHHDPPWQRERFAHIIELPPTDPAWIHVTINQLTEKEFADRRIVATTILNGFDVPSELGDRAATRTQLGVGQSDRLVVHPVRAIARKNIPAAITLAEALDASYWLTGAAEDGYGAELALLLADAACPVLRGTAASFGRSVADLYAAGDIVAFPSTWEGFGNPLIEAALHLRPAAVAEYPVLDELRALGFEWLPIADLDAIERELSSPDLERRHHNRELAARELSMEALEKRLQALLDRAGWWP